METDRGSPGSSPAFPAIPSWQWCLGWVEPDSKLALARGPRYLGGSAGCCGKSDGLLPTIGTLSSILFPNGGPAICQVHSPSLEALETGSGVGVILRDPL